MRNAEIAAALDELGDLYELDGAVVYRVVAYRQAARAVRDSPVRAQLARRRATESDRQDARREDQGLSRPVRSRPPRSSGGVPGRAGPVRRDPRPRPEDGPQDLRRARHQHARRAARGADGRDAALDQGLGPKAEQNIVAALDRSDRGPASGACCSSVLPLGDQIVERAARPSRPRTASRSAGGARRMTDTCKDLDVDRHREGRRRRSPQAFTRPGARRRVRYNGEAGARSSPTTACASISASLRRSSSATCSST